MEESLLGLFENAPHFISLLAGIVTFLSPCVLPLIPIYLSYISEISLDELKNTGALNLKTRFKILRSALFFVLGLGVVFIVFGAVAARILNGGILLSPNLRYFAGGVLIIFGLHTLGIFKIPFLNYQKTLRTNTNFEVLKDFFTPFLLGVSFSLGWTPCVGPILASIIVLASVDGQSGIVLLIIYTLGLALPFLLCALLISYAFSILDGIKRYFKVIEWCAGLLLIGVGILVASGGMSVLSAYLLKVL
ncbi:cytochrome c biogenesis protein CcdA [uncultured Helicobacter sp.]|uniref:cytochrome c biogenesis CcdA family protein n=1 Tax=uncultured Helicobacter sp. TaxID=175537 RepID=UPI002617785E|nr:cytochrome c biogenesis protein CcdA [uncultured Helicobacter sp.]